MNKKKKRIVTIALCCFLVGIIIGALIFFNREQQNSFTFQELCGCDNQGEFMVATISLRESEKGEVTDLMEQTSEDRAQMPEDIFKLLEGFSFVSEQQKAQSKDLVSLSIAFDSRTAIRFEFYRDGTVLVLGGGLGGIYRDVPAPEGGNCAYDVLYTYLTGEAPV